jgi:hypothetical protein
MNSRIFAAFNFVRFSPGEIENIGHHHKLSNQLNPFADYGIKRCQKIVISKLVLSNENEIS